MLLTKKEILDELNKLTDWEFIDSKIVKLIRREYIEELSSPKEKNFENYLTLAVSAIWSIAEKVDHHPDILITYSGIKITLFTHDESGVTSKDINFAHDLHAALCAIDLSIKPSHPKNLLNIKEDE